MDIVRTAIEELKNMDDEHGAFWVGLVKNDESILEVHKNLKLVGIFEDEPEIEYKGQGTNWTEIESMFETFLADKMDIIKTKLNREQ
jgi:hypothetical protein